MNDGEVRYTAEQWQSLVQTAHDCRQLPWCREILEFAERHHVTGGFAFYHEGELYAYRLGPPGPARYLLARIDRAATADEYH